MANDDDTIITIQRFVDKMTMIIEADSSAPSQEYDGLLLTMFIAAAHLAIKIFPGIYFITIKIISLYRNVKAYKRKKKGEKYLKTVWGKLSSKKEEE